MEPLVLRESTPDATAMTELIGNATIQTAAADANYWGLWNSAHGDPQNQLQVWSACRIPLKYRSHT